jgi:drug/metabolite transporter (DMT)-like permease
MSIKVLISGLLMSLIFGMSFLFTKNALDYVNPFQFLAYRFFISFIFTNFLILIKVFKIRKINFIKLLPLAIFQPVLYFIFENFGVSYLNVSEAGIIISSIPVFVAIFSPIFLKEKTNKFQFLFIFCSLIGVILIMGVNSLSGNFKGILLMFFAVISATAYNMISRKMSLSYTPQETTYIMMSVGALVFNTIFLFSGNFNYSELFIKPVFISAIYLGIFSSTLTFFLINYMLSKVTAVQSSIFANITTVVSVLAGAIFRNESIKLYHLIGMLFIIAGVTGVNYFSNKIKKQAL